MKKEHKILLAVAIFYFLYLVLFLGKFDFNPSAAIFLGDENLNKYSENLSPNLVVLKNNTGYDGQIYYLMAVALPQYSQFKPLRYQRILYPALAYLLAFGNIKLISWSLMLINYFAIILGVYFLLLILKNHGANLYLALLWAFNVGFLATVNKDLIEPLLYLLVILIFYFLEKKKFFISSLFLALALFTKEIALAVALPLLIYFLVKKQFKNVLIYFWPLVLYFAWQLVLFFWFKSSGLLVSQKANLTFPFFNLAEYIFKIDPAKMVQTLNSFYDYNVIILLAFVLFSLFIFLRQNFKLTLYSLLFIFQIILFFSIKNELYFSHVDNAGRLVMGLFLFYLLYVAERKEKYNLLLAGLNLVLSINYLYWTIFIFKADYFLI